MTYVHQMPFSARKNDYRKMVFVLQGEDCWTIIMEGQEPNTFVKRNQGVAQVEVLQKLPAASKST